jgi:hypothetical protein
MSATTPAQSLSETWDISNDDFPTGGTAAEKLQFLVNYAVLAPSSHNSQPWLFHIWDDRLDLYADRLRALPVVDPDDRELIISCGAALFQLCIAMRHFGYEGEINLLAKGADSDLLARVRLGPPWEPTEEDHALFYAIPSRRTNRMPFFKRRIAQPLLDALRDAAQKQGTWLHIFQSRDDRTMLATLISEGDRIQWSNPHFRRELATWLHPNRSMSNDGLPGYAIGLGNLMSMAGPLAVRTFDMGNGRAARDNELAAGSPVLAVLGTPGDTHRDWLKAGEALARVLLLATIDGVSASFLNQPIEVRGLRAVLCDFVDDQGYPQIILRLGYGPEVPLTPRRPVSDVII